MCMTEVERIDFHGHVQSVISCLLKSCIIKVTNLWRKLVSWEPGLHYCLGTVRVLNVHFLLSTTYVYVDMKKNEISNSYCTLFEDLLRILGGKLTWLSNFIIKKSLFSKEKMKEISTWNKNQHLNMTSFLITCVSSVHFCAGLHISNVTRAPRVVTAVQNGGQMMKYTQLTYYTFSNLPRIQKCCSEFNFLTCR